MLKKKLEMVCSQDESDSQRAISICDYDTISNRSMPIYRMPVASVSSEELIFEPSEWNISRFEIGRPLGQGKYSLNSMQIRPRLFSSVAPKQVRSCHQSPLKKTNPQLNSCPPNTQINLNPNAPPTPQHPSHVRFFPRSQAYILHTGVRLRRWALQAPQVARQIPIALSKQIHQSANRCAYLPPSKQSHPSRYQTRKSAIMLGRCSQDIGLRLVDKSPIKQTQDNVWDYGLSLSRNGRTSRSRRDSRPVVFRSTGVWTGLGKTTILISDQQINIQENKERWAADSSGVFQWVERFCFEDVS